MGSIQTAPAFHRLDVRSETSSCVVDLVAEATESLEDPQRIRLGDVEILVDTPREVLVYKLCALLGRSEIRDLRDVGLLLKSGLDLADAAREAPRKDAGFSPLTLAWALKDLPVRTLCAQAGLDDVEVREAEGVRDALVRELVAMSVPR